MKKQYLFLCGILLVGVLLVFGCVSYVEKQKLDINNIDAKTMYFQLLELDNIGPVIAKRVTDYVMQNRPININELDNIPGIGPKRLKEIKRKFKE